ncbi:MAG: Pycsar system effector family protein [Actinomycetota bacterium]
MDYALRTLSQQLTVLSGQADLKASIVITASSLVLSISASNWSDEDLRAGLVITAAGVLVAMIAAIVAVIPKMPLKIEGAAVPADRNRFFFGHAALLDRERYLSEMLEVLADDERLYRELISDLHAQSQYLLRRKYTWLRISYVALLLAFGVGVPVGLVTAVT